jgi:hypothetical protein
LCLKKIVGQGGLGKARIRKTWFLGRLVIKIQERAYNGKRKLFAATPKSQPIRG